MNDKMIKSAITNENTTRKCFAMDSELEIIVVSDKGASVEYLRQLGNAKTWVASKMRVFQTESDMMNFAAYFNQETGLPSQKRPATSAQIKYMIALGVSIEENMTVERASQLIDFAKSGDGVGSIAGSMTDGSF